MKCTNPFTMKYEDKPYKVNCNRCLACRINRTTQWSLRILSELPETQGKGIFLTLTYNDIFLPLVKGEDNQLHMSLQLKDVQDFIKRLRKNIKIHKYYLAGEYGSITKRPHYHIIMLGDINKNKHEQLIKEKWKLGNIMIGTITTASIRYVTSYIMDKDADNKYEGEPPFMTCSQNFGTKYILNEIEQIIQQGYIIGKHGEKIAIPKYIREKYPDKLKSNSIENQINWFKQHNIKYRIKWREGKVIPTQEDAKRYWEYIDMEENENKQRDRNLNKIKQIKNNKEI
jgi:hypothetical protein